ncbi:hypothetical protein YC2023_058707 [Brassica napus]
MSSSLIFTFIFTLCLLSSCFSSSASLHNATDENVTLRPQHEIQKLKLIREHLQKINKPTVKTIQSPDGDTIDCVPSHHQPAFDHPMLQGQRPMDPPEMPTGYSQENESHEDFQLWSLTGESCPEGTIPIRRTTEQDMLRASSVRRFGRKIRRVRRDSSSNGHEHAVGYVSGSQYYGAKASINVWTPRVSSRYEFSLSQIWVIAGSFADDLNTIEAGWQARATQSCTETLTQDSSPIGRYTNCFHATSKTPFALTYAPMRTRQQDAITYCVPVLFRQTIELRSELPFLRFHRIKDPKHGHWWLQFGSGTLVGYWPVSLFTHLMEHGNMVQFGGEIVNTKPGGSHTSTQMGSGHFAGEGFGKASYFRNLEMVDWDNTLIPTANLRVLADHPNCYDIRGGVNRVWGNYFYYGGPGKNSKCP